MRVRSRFVILHVMVGSTGSSSATEEKPRRETYERWLRRRFRSKELLRGAVHFESVALAIRDQFERSTFWRDVLARLSDWTAAYNIATGEVLLSEAPHGLLVKDWDSFVDKTYRRNVSLNDNWPDPPDGGWVLPPGWFSDITDIVRTMLVARYLDGVHFLGRRFVELAEEHALSADVDLQAKPEGYYAAHVIVRTPLRIPTVDLRYETREVGVEIQITTQIQEVLRALLHRQYARARMSPPDLSWQWNWDRPEFSVGYLGHILHYVEGRIVSLRTERIEEGTDGSS